jgi:chemotaxis protein MotB
MANPQPPVLLIKKKASHAGHHGGAWKVAYADFVTALMALFIVLWLMSSTTKQQQMEISGYFRDPNGTATHKGLEREEKKGENILLNQQDMTKLKTALLQSIHRVDPLDKLKKQIEITITPEGLRIELMEDPSGTFFQIGSTQPTPVLVSILKVLSTQLGGLPNRISIEGHTDAQPYSNNKTYSNWELSSDRANVARRLMQTSGVRLNQVSQVRGFADQRLRDTKNPFDAANRRISLIVQYLEAGYNAPSIVVAGGQSHPGSTAGKPDPGIIPVTALLNPSSAPPLLHSGKNPGQ